MMLNSMARIALAAWLGGLIPGVARAQQQEPLQVGARIRVMVGPPDSVRRTGTFGGVTDSRLQLSTGTETLSLPLTTIRQLERSTGRPWSVPGGIVGAVLGAGVGGLLGCAANRDSYGVLCGGQDDTKVIAGAVLGGVAGGLAGALIFRREHWQPVALSGVTR